ncbi:HutD family protein [Luteibacter sp.]|jgi:hypothetical protein|uniref:HutD/Ves family protein n=1 Tax=Luteibacter sp. TaxID=1886636 RepID=UPI002F3FB48E
MSILRFDELTPVPWKNGLGITREIVVDPPGSTMDDFLWRVSIADVDTASPFSRFPGIDRTIVLLEGDGFTMVLDGEREHALTTPCVPFSFPGEAQVEVELAGGATRDFNLMIRRGRVHGTLDVVSGPASLSTDDVTLLHLARGNAVIDGIACATGDTVTMPRSVDLSARSTVLLIRITPIGP